MKIGRNAILAFGLLACACEPSENGERDASRPSLLRAGQPASIVMGAELRGRLVVEDGCFVVRHAAGQHAVVWPYDASVVRERGGVAVESRSTGSHARLNAQVALRGGETSGLDAAHVEGGVSGQAGACKAPYWVAQAFEPAS